jgi:hypothetical protein
MKSRICDLRNKHKKIIGFAIRELAYQGNLWIGNSGKSPKICGLEKKHCMPTF